jgi:hypothetical protein
VDYVVKDISAIQSKLFEEAVQVIRQKQERYKLLLQLSFRPFIQIHQEKHHIYYPSENYDTYTAHESAEITNYYYNNGYRVKGSRKNKTFFFNALTPDGFDRVIHPVVKEPMVQFTCYLKIKAEIDR